MRLLILLSVFLSALCGDLLAAAEKPKIIFDTDITGDVDDVLALTMCHSLADRGACEFLGITISKNNPLTVPFIDAQNTFHGRPDLPIGVTRDAQAQHRESRYLKAIQTGHYPHDLKANADAPDAITLLRDLLTAQPDHSVTLISVGIASNLANLIKSPGGIDLIKTKVKTLSIMAGAFAFCNNTNYHLEANVINGIGYMQTVADQWPATVPIVWSGFEIGESLPYPRLSIARDFDYLPHHIVKETYLLHSGPDHDRPCWDQSSVLQAVFPERNYFGLSQPGRVQVLPDGFTRFHPARKPDSSRRDRFLTLSPTQEARALEAIVHLVVQPPLKKHTN
jgi:purine nucleosidase